MDLYLLTFIGWNVIGLVCYFMISCITFDAKLSKNQRIFIRTICGPSVWLLRGIMVFWQMLE